jgi:hypothetical protein
MSVPTCIDSQRDKVAVTTESQPPAKDRLRPCGCGAVFLPKHKQQFCSRRCASKARVGRQRPVLPPLERGHHIVLRLLNCQPLERRARGGWRFGAKRISDKLVARLIASGRAEIRGEQLHKRTEAP